MQWKIFKTAFLGKGKAVYLVGDPKQSIYGFRNADIYTYLDAVRRSEKKISPFRHNYRSDRALVKALNALFTKPQKGSGCSCPRSCFASLFRGEGKKRRGQPVGRWERKPPLRLRRRIRRKRMQTAFFLVSPEKSSNSMSKTKLVSAHRGFSQRPISGGKTPGVFKSVQDSLFYQKSGKFGPIPMLCFG